MKTSVGQKLPQGTSSNMSRHDLEDIEKTETPTTNVFLIETVLRRLFKQIESVTMLKDLRRMCQLWDKVNTEELEDRAFEGKFKPINLTFFNEVSKELKPIKIIRLEMRRFLDDTSSNPRLFRSFTIIFPCSLAFLNLHKFRCFYTDYSPTLLDLAFPFTFRCNQKKEGLLKELLRWAAPTLRELVIRNTFARESDLIPTRKSLPVQSFNFPHLRKVNTSISGINHDVVDAFKVIFTQENHPETPSLISLKLRYGYPGAPDILELISSPSRWTTITKLDILCDANTYELLNQFTNGLLSLARAGMTLKKLDLGLQLDNDPWDSVDPHILKSCRNLSQFFASQSGTLETLKLSFEIYLDVSIEEDYEGQMKILLPVFDRLRSLSLNLDTHVCINGILTRNIFEFGSISQHFPALENLNILGFAGPLDEFLGGPCEEVVERMNLKRIKWIGGNEDGLHLDKYFEVEAFACSQASLQNFRILGDLEDTIRVLHIQDVNSELDLSRYKGLRKVVIEENDKARRIYNKKLDMHEGDYLSYFKKIAELGLDSIMFRGLEMIEGQSYKEFAEAFPFLELNLKISQWIGLTRISLTIKSTIPYFNISYSSSYKLYYL